MTGALLLLFSLPPLSAHAGPVEEADALYKEGRALIDQGKYAEACPKLAAATELDPTLGTLMGLADCYDRNGQTASAWTTFGNAEMKAREAKNKRAADEAARRAGLLEPKLSRLVVEVAPDNLGEGFNVQRNGKPLEPGQFGTAIPVDPGEHTLEATASGKQPWREKLRIEPTQSLTTVRIPPLAEASPHPAPVTPKPAPALTPLTGDTDRATSTWSTQRTVGLVLGGVGVVGGVIGAVAGALTLSTIREAKDKGYCTDSDPPQCNQQGYDLHQKANTTANIANVSLAVGGAALVAGIVVFATAPSGASKEPTGLRVHVGPSVGMGTAGLSLRGEW